MDTKKSIYEQVTDDLINKMEQGNIPWQSPFSKVGKSQALPLRACGEAYKGINVVILWATAMAKGYASPYWFTFKQAKALGAFVRKGEKAATVCYWSTFKKEETSDSGEVEEKNIPFAKAFWVFNAQQIDGLDEKYYPKPEPIDETKQFTRNEVIDAFIQSLGADIKNLDQCRAYYVPSQDYISIPSMLDFINAERYYGTLFHELAHWTGHETRLDRKLSTKFGSEKYAQEELVAELSAAFQSALFGFGDVTREDHAAYLQNWLQALNNDKKFIFKAASMAQKACDYLSSLSTNQERRAA